MNRVVVDDVADVAASNSLIADSWIINCACSTNIEDFHGHVLKS